MARPKAKVDGKQVEKLAGFGCTQSEIAQFFSTSENTICRRFGAEYNKGRDGMKLRLRQAQIHAALRGNVVMLIFLGKQYLGQTDKQEITGAVPVKVIDESSDS